MSVQLPAWCGACDPSTRRFNLGDEERRCHTCHPFWAFRLATVDPYHVPADRAEQEQAARWLLYELVGLRALPLPELRRRTEVFFEAGWTPADIMHALAFDPVGARIRLQPANPLTPEQSGRLVLSLLEAWCDEQGRPLQAPSKLEAQRHDRLRAHQRQVRAVRAEAESRAAGPQSPGRLAARQAAAEAASRGRQLQTIGQQREYAARVAARALQQAQEVKADQALRRLEKWRFSVVPATRDVEAAEAGPVDSGRIDAGLPDGQPGGPVVGATQPPTLRSVRKVDAAAAPRRARKAAVPRRASGDLGQSAA
jgi:hypothetical protein